VPDPFIAWIFKQSKRILAACVAVGVIAFVASIALWAVALMVDALHHVLHAILSILSSTNHVYMQSGLVGQGVLICLVGGGLVFAISRGGRFLYQSFCHRGGIAS